MIQAGLDFAIVGSQRAGSSFLGGLLDAQPALHVPREEIPFFEPDHYDRALVPELDRVFDLPADGGTLRGIKCADYFARPGSEANLLDGAGRIPVIAVLRQPAERAISAYHWYVARGLLPAKPIDEGMADLLAGYRDGRAFEVLDYGRYEAHLPRWWDCFGGDSVLVLRTDRLRDESTAARLTAFLGRSVDPPVPGSRRRANEGAYDLRRVRWLRHKRRFRSYVRNGEFDFDRRGVGRVVDGAITGVVKAVDDLVLSRIWTTPDVAAPSTLDRLQEYYAPTIDWLAEHVDGGYGAWAHSTEAV